MVIPTPDSGILKRVYANLVGAGGALSLDIPDKILKRLYTYGSLKNTDEGIEFEAKNRLQDAKFAGVNRTQINGDQVDPSRIRLETADGEVLRLDQVAENDPIPSRSGAPSPSSSRTWNCRPATTRSSWSSPPSRSAT
jgi:hydroxymethylglutaryl-CoA reductase (NADPH)